MALFDIVLPTDHVTASDVITRQLNAGVITRFFDVQISDEVSVTDALPRDVIVSDTIAVTDQLQVAIIDTLEIDNARALSATKVRIDFSKAALDPTGGANPALSNPASYTFAVITPGAVDIIPQSVDLPPGQTNPLYVEVVVSEHTNGATYEVSLSPAILGTGDSVGGGPAFSYVGIGAAPIVERVFATSPNEALVFFNEAILNNPSANDVANYVWNNGLETTAVKSVVGNLVTLGTTTQVEGELYNLTVIGYNALIDEDGELLIDEDGEILVDEEDGG